jgi:hypothetical protein
MTVEVLRARTEKWPQSQHTPDGVAAQLARSRQMFVGYYTYENFIDAATRSLQAIEAALRVRLEAGSNISFAQLIDRTKKEGLIDDHGQGILHTGRILRNQQVHATTTAVFNPAIAAAVIETSHSGSRAIRRLTSHATGSRTGHVHAIVDHLLARALVYRAMPSYIWHLPRAGHACGRSPGIPYGGSGLAARRSQAGLIAPTGSATHSPSRAARSPLRTSRGC